MLEANDLSRVKRVVQENKVDGMIRNPGADQ